MTAVLDASVRPAGPPTCKVRLAKDKKEGKPPCGRIMVPVGNPDNFVYVCPKCDIVEDRENQELLNRRLN